MSSVVCDAHDAQQQLGSPWRAAVYLGCVHRLLLSKDGKRDAIGLRQSCIKGTSGELSDPATKITFSEGPRIVGVRPGLHAVSTVHVQHRMHVTVEANRIISFVQE